MVPNKKWPEKYIVHRQKKGRSRLNVWNKFFERIGKKSEKRQNFLKDLEKEWKIVRWNFIDFFMFFFRNLMIFGKTLFEQSSILFENKPTRNIVFVFFFVWCSLCWPENNSFQLLQLKIKYWKKKKHKWMINEEIKR